MILSNSGPMIDVMTENESLLQEKLSELLRDYTICMPNMMREMILLLDRLHKQKEWVDIEQRVRLQIINEQFIKNLHHSHPILSFSEMSDFYQELVEMDRHAEFQKIRSLKVQTERLKQR